MLPVPPDELADAQAAVARLYRVAGIARPVPLAVRADAKAGKGWFVHQDGTVTARVKPSERLSLLERTDEALPVLAAGKPKTPKEAEREATLILSRVGWPPTRYWPSKPSFDGPYAQISLNPRPFGYPTDGNGQGLAVRWDRRTGQVVRLWLNEATYAKPKPSVTAATAQAAAKKAGLRGTLVVSMPFWSGTLSKPQPRLAISVAEKRPFGGKAVILDASTARVLRVEDRRVK